MKTTVILRSAASPDSLDKDEHENSMCRPVGERCKSAPHAPLGTGLRCPDEINEKLRVAAEAVAKCKIELLNQKGEKNLSKIYILIVKKFVMISNETTTHYFMTHGLIWAEFCVTCQRIAAQLAALLAPGAGRKTAVP